MVIDPFQTPELAEAVFAQVKAVTDQPIKYVLNTHYHFDHTGGNPTARNAVFPLLAGAKLGNTSRIGGASTVSFHLLFPLM
jgi:Metallo-beta-lactamase superfamily.